MCGAWDLGKKLIRCELDPALMRIEDVFVMQCGRCMFCSCGVLCREMFCCYVVRPNLVTAKHLMHLNHLNMSCIRCYSFTCTDALLISLHYITKRICGRYYVSATRCIAVQLGAGNSEEVTWIKAQHG